MASSREDVSLHVLPTTVVIPLSKPSFGEREERALVRCFRKGEWASGGSASLKLERALKKRTNAGEVFLTTSGTSALELAFMALGVRPGNEILVPSFTFPTTATSFMRMGALPRFCDVDLQSYNVTAETLASQWTPKCKGVVVVHYAGRACQMDQILRFAKIKRLWVVEDAAHAMGSRFNGVPLGTWGDFGAFSFHQTKNLVCGEGGALVARKSDRRQVVERCLEKGTNRRDFLQGIINKYQWVSMGSSFGMSDLLSSFLTPQIDRMEFLTDRRRAVSDVYLDGLAQRKGPWIAPLPDLKKEGNWHLFAVRVPAQMRLAWIRWMRGHGIETSSHFEPLHTSPFGRTLYRGRLSLPVTEKISKEILRLPIHPLISTRTARFIINTFVRFMDR